MSDASQVKEPPKNPNRVGRKRKEPEPPTVFAVAQAAAKAKRDAARAEILRQRAEAQQAVETAESGKCTVVEDQTETLRRHMGMPRGRHSPLLETRAFCVGEAQRFGDKRLLGLKKACQGNVFFKGYERGKWPDSSPYA